MKQSRNYMIGVILALIPVMAALYYAIGYSFGGFEGQDTGLTLVYWEALLNDPALGASLWFSFKNSVLSLCITFPLAFYIARKEYYQGRDKIHLLYFIPLAIPPIVAAYLGYQWLGGGAWLSRMSYHAGLIESTRDFPGLIYTASGFGIIIVHALLLLPFFTILIHAYYQNNNIAALKELSRNLGVSGPYFFIKVTLPLILRKATPMILLYLILLMGAYEVPLLIGGQHPKMLSIFIVEKLQRFDLANMPQAYAVALLFFVFVSLILFTLLRFVTKKYMQRL